MPGCRGSTGQHGRNERSVPVPGVAVARALGTSERAVRERITAGTLDAEKDRPADARQESEAAPAATEAERKDALGRYRPVPTSAPSPS